jgi:DNA-binding HxlR family transcriptional regulator
VRCSLARLTQALCLRFAGQGCPSSPDKPPAIPTHGGFGLRRALSGIFDRVSVEKHEDLRACPALSAAFALLGKRWTALILDVIAARPARFGEIQRAIPGLSERLLAERLRELAMHGLVERRAPEGKTIVYVLTPLGVRLLPALDEIRTWARELEPAGSTSEPA